MAKTIDHAGRAHSILSASGAYRWLVCTPSALLEQQFPDTTSGSAAEGTLAHELAELKLRNYFDTTNFGKRKLTAAVKKLKENPLWNDEMDRYTDEYLDYVKAIAMKPKAAVSPRIEQRIYFGKYTLAERGGEGEGYGTADCILIGDGTIHVIDFKYGQSPNGRVSAEQNPQLALYALGAYETYRILYNITRAELHIFQPRLSDGISEWAVQITDLLGWGDYVRERADLAWKGEGEYRPDADKACQFCRAKGRCRARAEHNVRLAFSTDLGKKPPLISNEQIGEYLKMGADVAKWLSDLQDTALKECLAGREVPGWKAVEGRGGRAWTDLDMAFAALELDGVPQEMLWKREPITPAALEKILGKKEYEAQAAGLVTKTPGKPTLAKESDKRPAVTNRVTAAEAFKEEREEN